MTHFPSKLLFELSLNFSINKYLKMSKQVLDQKSQNNKQKKLVKCREICMRKNPSNCNIKKLNKAIASQFYELFHFQRVKKFVKLQNY